MTQCECVEPGWCERHQCDKTAHWHTLCRTRPDYFALWEAGRGPGQTTGQPINPAAEHPCRHQGEVLRSQLCPTCGGTVRLKVFACALHTECTLSKWLEGTACCRTCEDYVRTDSPVNAHCEHE